jgi:hypothetical protein
MSIPNSLTPRPDWQDAPHWANWLTCSKSLGWVWHERRPVYDYRTPAWKSSSLQEPTGTEPPGGPVRFSTLCERLPRNLPEPSEGEGELPPGSKTSDPPTPPASGDFGHDRGRAYGDNHDTLAEELHREAEERAQKAREQEKLQEEAEEEARRQQNAALQQQLQVHLELTLTQGQETPGPEPTLPHEPEKAQEVEGLDQALEFESDPERVHAEAYDREFQSRVQRSVEAVKRAQTFEKKLEIEPEVDIGNQAKESEQQGLWRPSQGREVDRDQGLER